MSRSHFCRSLTVLALVAGAARAGTIYVPLPGVSQVGSAGWEAEVTIANPSSQSLIVNALLLNNDSDGTVRGTPPSPGAPYTADAGRSLVLRPAATFSGLAEISGSPNARYAARLTGHGALGAMGVALPVITSANAAAGNATLALQGLTSSASRATAIDLVNLAPFTSQCTVALLRSDGSAVGAPRTVAMKPLSAQYLANVFAGLVDAAGLADARAAVSCSRDFYAFALLSDSASGEVSVVQPSGSGESTLTKPGTEPACPTGATCFLAPGVISRPTPATPVGHVIFNAPAGVFKRLKLTLDVTVGDWFGGQPDGKHLVYWFVINKNIDMPGMLYFRGPEAFTALVRYGIGLKHPQKLKLTAPFQAIAGHTYRCINDYDMGLGVYTVTLIDLGTGQVVQTLTGPTNVDKVTLKTGDHFLVDMGFKEGLVFDEVPSYNWVYSDVRVQAIP
ncbi:MAG TPA: hypothetical protein VGV61_19060 [Thermoanaerobaculia bacterium]|jgi:hypothetical protein|nr:hypothetical protein [Thermoanaerobaculia bacterium]